MKIKKVEKALLDAYRIAYAQSNPPVDFDEVLEKIKLSENDFDYNNHYLCIDKQEEVLEEVSKKYKLSKVERRMLEINYNLGCSPSTNPCRVK